MLTYVLDEGNGNNGDAYEGCNIRIRDTFLNLGNGTHAVGPGTLVLRIPSDGAGSPADGTAEVLYYHLPQEFATTTAGITITTDVDSASPELGETDNVIAQATGVITLGATPEIVWDACSFPAGYNDTTTSYTPDVVGTGAGCLAPYRSTGNVNCLDESLLADCSSGGLLDGDNPQDETWELALETLTFSGDLSSFDMPMTMVPNRQDSRTYMSWSGTLVEMVCD